MVADYQDYLSLLSDDALEDEIQTASENDVPFIKEEMETRGWFDTDVRQEQIKDYERL